MVFYCGVANLFRRAIYSKPRPGCKRSGFPVTSSLRQHARRPPRSAMKPAPKEVTLMLQQLNSGDQDVLSMLVPLLYDELRRLASYHLRRERPNHTLQTTALVHEAYLRLVNQSQVVWKNRSHFLGVAAQLMRRILVDYARSHHAAKRGAHAEKISLEDVAVVSRDNLGELLALDQVLGRLAAFDPQQAKIVELR